MKPLFKILLFSFRMLLLLFLFLGRSGHVLAQEEPSDLPSVITEAKRLGIPEATLNDLLAMGYGKRLEPDRMASMLHVLIEAQRESIPLQPLVSKIEEGVLKGVPTASVEQAVKGKLENYLLTRSLLESYSRTHGQPLTISPEYLVRVTECLYCGLSRDELKNILLSAPAAPIPVLTRGIEVFASLRQSGFDSRHAQEIVFTGISKGYFTSETRDFARVMAVAKRKGVDEKRIVDVATSGIADRLDTTGISSRLGISPEEVGSHGPRIGGGPFHGGHGGGQGGGGGHGYGGGGGGSHGGGGHGGGGGGGGRR